MNQLQHRAGALSLAAVVIGLAGCGGGSDNNTNSGGGQQGTSQIRVFNAIVPTNGASSTLNVSGSGTTLSGQNGLAYGQLSPAFGYTTVSSGTFTPSGTGAGFTNPIQLGSNAGLAANSNYMLVASGMMGQAGTQSPQFFLLPNYDQTTNPIPAGQAAIRFVNLSPGANSYGLYSRGTTGLSTPLSNSMSSVGYGFGANNTYVTVPLAAGTTYSIRNAGSSNLDVPLANGGSTNNSFQSGHAYTVFLYGQEGNVAQPLSSTVVTDI